MMTEEDMRLEIARLESAVHQAKSVPTTTATSWRHPASAPYHKPFRGYRGTSGGYKNVAHRPTTDPSREVVIGGQTFQANSRTLTRKPTVPTPSTSTTATPATAGASSTTLVSKPPSSGLIRTKPGSLVSGNKPVRPRSRSLAKRGRGGNMSLVLNGTTRPVKEKRRVKSERKQCKYFTRTGICTRGNVCRFQHDANKTAICPRFLTDQCPNTADRCPLSHYPTPERVPVCVHFQNFGQCRNGDKCLYPHVRLGSKVSGVCRDFAVLGYCEKGIECTKGHVRECPDFADTGRCPTKGCKLPHVIRAKRSGPPPPHPSVTTATQSKTAEDKKIDASDAPPLASSEATDHGNIHPSGSFADGDEFISLTFHESESDSEEDEDDDDEEGSEDDSSDSPDDTVMIS